MRPRKKKKKEKNRETKKITGRDDVLTVNKTST
jgi:hypothetical protein